MKTVHAIVLCLLALVLVASSVSCMSADVRGERSADSSAPFRSRLSTGSFSSQPPKKVLPPRKVGPIRLPPKTQTPSTIATPTLPTGKPIRPTSQIPAQQTKPTRVIPKQLPVNVKPIGRTGTPGPAMKPGLKRSNSAPNLQVGASSKPTPPSLKRSNSMPLLTTKKKGKAVSIQTLAPLLKKYGLLTTALIELMGSSESGVTAPRCDQSLEKGKNGPSLVNTRVSLRGDVDPKDINGFTFSLDTKGRVSYASGPVSNKNRGELSKEAYCIADRMWYEDNNNARDRDLMHTGHIVASALGGTDRDPINFFPQHANSNSRGGVWWVVELIAGETANLLSKGCVHIQPQLEYPDVSTWIPNKGLYYFDISDKCLTQLATVGKLNSRARVFREIMDDPAFSQVETTLGGQPGRGVLITWENAYDKRTLASHPELYESKKKH